MLSILKIIFYIITCSKLGAREIMNMYVHKLGLLFKYKYLTQKVFATTNMYYSLRFVLPNGELQVQRNSTGREDRECHSPRINPLHVMKTFQMTKNGPQKPSQLNLIQVGNKGRKRERRSSKADLHKNVLFPGTFQSQDRTETEPFK